MKPDEMGHAFVFSSKINNDDITDGLIDLLWNVKDHIKDPSITEIIEKQEQSLISIFPIDKLMCKPFSKFVKQTYIII